MRNLEIAITVYNENIDWVNQYNTSIYQKVDGLVTPYQLGNITYLPNIGKDVYSHLYHIITRYDTLSEFTLFTQADPFEHGEFTLEGITDSKFTGFNRRIGNWCGSVHLPYHGWKRLIHHDKWLKEFESGELMPAKTTYGEYWDEYIQKPKPAPETMVWYFGVIFCTHRDVIRQNPKEYYEKLLSTLNTKNSEEIHYFERSVYYILNCPSTVSY